MESVSIAARNQLGSSTAIAPLDSLAGAVQRVNNATVTVQNFLDRWHGPSPSPTEGADKEQSSYPHSQKLERLFAALDRLEERLGSLNAIG